MLISEASHVDVAAGLRLAVTRLSRRLRQQAADGLSPSQTAALSTVERHGPLTPSELATIERIKRPTATRVLGGLEEAGLIARQPDEEDRRVIQLNITREGAVQLKRLRSRKNAYLAKGLRQFDPEELATLRRATELIERLLESEEA